LSLNIKTDKKPLNSGDVCVAVVSIKILFAEKVMHVSNVRRKGFPGTCSLFARQWLLKGL
jgi:hypothetical protein